MSAHGTPGRYNHGCRCAVCRATARVRLRQYVRTRAACHVVVDGRLVAVDAPLHGLSTYKNYHCRCRACSAANADASRRYRRRRAERKI